MCQIRTFAAIIALAMTALIAVSGPATAGPSIDPGTLIPSPPDGADCRADGNKVICHTAVIEPERFNEPLLDLPCGTVYESSTDVRRGIRWYDARSRIIERRFVFFDLEGTWSLSASGAGPTARVTGRAVMRNVTITDPEDPDSWPTTFRGAGFTVLARGFGVIAQIGSPQGYDPDDFTHGVTQAIAAPDVAGELCAALGT